MRTDDLGSSRFSQEAEDPAHTALRELFLAQLADMYDAEKKLTRALPLVAKAANGGDLKALLEVHLGETKGHVETIESIAEGLEVELPRKSCHAMTGLIKETVGLLIKEFRSTALDAAVISAGQKIEHYEIASYGTLCAWARVLALQHEYALLESILDQEKNADYLLTGVAKGNVPLKELIEQMSLKNAGATSA
jgi:ferritin-like metal-binding protein YciE